MSKKKNSQKISYVAPAAIVALILVRVFWGGEINKIAEILVITLAVIGLFGGIIALSCRPNRTQKLTVIVSMVLGLYLGGVAVYRLILSGIGFLG